MGIDEAGHHDEAREVLDFGNLALEVRSDGCNEAVLDGYVHDAVSAVDRVHDTGILEKTIPHNLDSPFGRCGARPPGLLVGWWRAPARLSLTLPAEFPIQCEALSGDG